MLDAEKCQCQQIIILLGYSRHIIVEYNPNTTGQMKTRQYVKAVFVMEGIHPNSS